MHVHLEVEGLARGEEIALLRGEKTHGGSGVADDDRGGAGGGAALAVCHGELDVEVARGREGHRKFFALAELFVPGLQFPGVTQFATIQVARSLGGEVRRKRGGTRGVGHGEFGRRLEVAAEVRDLEQRGVGISAPGVAVIQQVETAVGTECGVDGAAQDGGAVVDERLLLLALLIGVGGHECRGGEGLQADQIRVGVEAGPFDERALPIPEEQGAVKVFREAVGLFVRFLPVEHGAGTGGAAAFAEFRPLFGDQVRPVDQRGHGGREFNKAGVVAALVERRLGVEERPHGLGRVVVFRVGEIIAHEEGVTVIARLFGLVDLVVPAGPPGTVKTRVGPHFTPIHIARFRIDA